MKKILSFILIIGLVNTTSTWAQPTISSFSPTSGQAGISVVINGSGFSATTSANTVYFGAVKADVTAASATSLTVTVPTGSTYQPISVTVNKLTAYSSKPFGVTFPGNGVSFNAVSFIQVKNIFSGANPRSIRTVDFDGDGRSDLVVSNQAGSSLSIFKNISPALADSFATKLELTVGAGVYKICTGDLNGDGKPDIVASNFNSGNVGAVSIFRNTSFFGNISFAPKIDSVTGNGSLGVAIGDLDGDGKPEILVAAGNSGIISIFKNTSANDSISFAAKINVSHLGHADNISVTDIDGDGKQDLVTSNFSDNSVSVFRNTSSGGVISFAAKVDFAVGTNPGDIGCSDFDGDGKTDIVVSCYGSNTISFLQNTSTVGNVSFAVKADLTTGIHPLELSIEDLDGDGKADVSLVNNTDSSFSVFKNNSTVGTISFMGKIDYKTGLMPNGICAGNLNSDNKPDIVVANGGVGTFSLFRNRLSEPKITSFLPAAATIGDTITIKGFNFTGTSTVNFGTISATSFTVLSDTVIAAVVGTGVAGYIIVRNPYGIDSLSGFVFKTPEINLTDTAKNTLSFSAIKGSYSGIKNFSITGKRLQSSIKITAPPFCQLSKNADSGFAALLSFPPINGTLDTTKVYVRIRVDSIAIVSGIISIEATNAVTKNISINGIICDSVIVFIPEINVSKKDSIICFRDSLLLSSNSGSFNIYKWSTGDTTRAVVIKKSENITLQVGTTAGCLSNLSATLRLVKNTNPIPTLALTGDSTLISSSASNYRWYFNNALVLGNTTNKLVAGKIGFYAVETSNDKICWDASNDFPIVTLPVPLVNDTVMLKTYPNPAPNGSFYVVATLQRATNVVARVTATDAAGNILLQTNKFIFFGREIKIPITLTVKGTVFVKIDINGDVKTQTVILQ